jgi:hypothetical protein|tara:strand:+ start:173 stop:283 length:111 start_codon:yes stop_codon:yes gene_type:complete
MTIKDEVTKRLLKVLELKKELKKARKEYNSFLNRNR